jgi:hypothetical protein
VVALKQLVAGLKRISNASKFKLQIELSGGSRDAQWVAS